MPYFVKELKELRRLLIAGVPILTIIFWYNFWLPLHRDQRPAPGIGYRLTATVDIAGTPHTYSQSYRYDCGRNRSGTIPHGVLCLVYGEAMAIDLGPRGTLFVLLRGAGMRNVNFLASSIQIAEQQHRPLVPDALPVMVRFRDLTKPETVEIVDPAHLDRTFGPNIAFRNLRVDPDPVAGKEGNIEKRLPWLDDLGFRPLAPGSKNVLATQLSRNDFVYDY